MGVDEGDDKEQGAGDQGLMFGYACNETDVLMPAPITYSHRLVRKQLEVMKSGELDWLLPDAKSQVTLRYEDHKPVASRRWCCRPSTRNRRSADAARSRHRNHSQAGTARRMAGAMQERKHSRQSDRPFRHRRSGGRCGLTGRKIIVDTYGGMARHGGGAFSGKDPSKVDRSAAYAARYVAKNIVAAGLAERCEVQVSYAIGVAEPTSISVDTFGTGKIDDDRIIALIREHFDLRPRA